MSTNAPSLPLGELFKRSWKLFEQKPLEHIVGGFIVSFLGALTLGLLMGPLMVGYVRMIDRQRKGESISIGNVFDGFDRFGAAFIASFITFWVGLVGLLLCVLPGLVVFAMWGFAPWFIALDGEGGFAALGSSFRLFKKRAGDVLVLALVDVLVQSAGAMVAFGRLLTFPVGVLLWAEAFEDARVPPP